MYGVDADDLMIGGAGNDSLWGVNNNDTLEGGLGSSSTAALYGISSP